jgi:endonuclease/exonuclease/phosphatase (EEP) superfamily protein YafD
MWRLLYVVTGGRGQVVASAPTPIPRSCAAQPLSGAAAGCERLRVAASGYVPAMPADPLRSDGGAVEREIVPVGPPQAAPIPARTVTSLPAYLAALICAAIVIGLPFAARLFDGSADEFNRRHFATGPAVGWVICALLTAIVVTRRLQILFSVEEGSAIALAYDALPLLLVGAWVVALAALVTGHWLLAIAAGGLCVEHLVLVLPRLMATRPPRWVKRAPRLQIVVANVYIDNETPREAAEQLVAADGDVVILVEATPSFMQVFDEVGGAAAYPFRVIDHDDDSDYAVAIATKRDLGPRSLMTRIGPLRLAIADIDVDGTSTLVVALNPMATLDPGGHVMWKEQIDVLREFVPTLSGPLIIAGDLNTTRYRPEFEELLTLGLSDAIDSLGKGINPSWKLRPDGVLGAVGAVVRLDHALTNRGMRAVSVENLEACGSDHLPFVLEVAVDTRSQRAARTEASATSQRNAGSG